MATPERLTIDMTVVHDHANPDRERHEQAEELLALADQDLVELLVAPQGGRADLPDGGWLAEELQALVASGRVTQAEQLAYISDLTVIPFRIGAGVDGFREAWQQVLATWKTDKGPAQQRQGPMVRRDARSRSRGRAHHRRRPPSCHVREARRVWLPDPRDGPERVPSEPSMKAGTGTKTASRCCGRGSGAPGAPALSASRPEVKRCRLRGAVR